MPIYFFQRDKNQRTNTAPNPIQAGSFTGTNRIVVLNNQTNLQVGDCIEIIGSTTNDGTYSVYNVVDLKNFDVLPLPNTEAVAGTVVLFRRQNFKTASIAITATTATRITAPGSLFVTNNVRLNDRVAIDAGANAGAWWVSAVVDENNIDVRPLSGGAAMTPGGSVGNNVRVRQGNHVIRVLDYGATVTTANILAGAAPMPQGGGGGGFFGSGVITDYWFRETVADSSLRTLNLTTGIGGVRLANTGAGGVTDFVLLNEVLVSRDVFGFSGDYGYASPIRPTIMSEDPNSVAGRSVVYFGTPSTGNRYHAEQGSAVIGWGLGREANGVSDATHGNVVCGSYVDDTAGAMNLYGGIYTGSILRDQVIPNTAQPGPAVVPAQFESCVCYDDPIIVADIEADFRNWLVSANPSGGVMFNFGGYYDITVEGLLKSDLVFTPLVSLYGLGCHFLNCREDYDVSELFNLVYVNANGYKEYTFDPRFVERDSVGNDPVAIPGLWITLYSDDGVSESLLGSWQTAASGHLTGIESDRDGINLVQQANLAGTEYSYKLRIKVEGGGRRFVNQTFEMDRYQRFDFPVDALASDFEEEGMST